MIRFAVKVGLAGSVVYYLNQEGIWRDSNESLKVYDKLNDNLKPYITEVKKQIPIQIPELPLSENTSSIVQEFWNRGILNTFEFLSVLPEKAACWTAQGVNAILQNPDVKKLLEGGPE